MRTTMTSRIPLTVVLACAAAAAASCAKVEADVPEAEVTQKAVAFQGLPGGHALGEVSTTQTFTLTSDNLSWAKDLNSEVYATEVELRAASGVQDLSFIHYARVTMSDGSGDSSVAPIEVVNYERPDNMTPSSVLSVKTVHPINVTQVWAAKKIVITMQLAGIFPEEAWSADVILHMGGKISYQF
jgi:hypothetical protein